MALATVQDIKRVMLIEDSNQARDAQLAAALEAAESWFLKRSRVQYDASGVQTATFFDINEDAAIHLPVEGATIEEVRIEGYATTVDQWTYDGEHEIRLRPYLLVEPFEGAVGRRFLRVLQKVEVDFTATSNVPAAVRDGVARLAGWAWATGPRQGATSGTVTGAIKSENLGGYSYTLETASQIAGGSMSGKKDDPLGDALVLLRPFLRKPRVSVT